MGISRSKRAGLWLSAGVMFLAEFGLAQTAQIVGTVRDKDTGDALPGANVVLEGTALGAATDLEGRFRILRIPPGSYVVRVSYIGYQSQQIPVILSPGETQRLDVRMAFEVLRGKEVVITAQAEGQVAAINRQLQANTITNVVSAERILELPDYNAAESVGRLPGISIKRSGGEGNRVVIRGLSPTYNLVSIAGDRVPATDLDDRSVDMDMIAPEILAGIEVVKALTPDRDADAFGGVVNFDLANAPDGGFRFSSRVYHGYGAERNDPNQYKASFIMSNRYGRGRFGILVTGNLERAQRGSDKLSASYNVVREKRPGEEFAPIAVSSVYLRYVDEVRRRRGFSVLADYRLPNGRLNLRNFVSRLDRWERTWDNRYNEDSNWHERHYRDRRAQTDVLTNSLSGEHRLGFGSVDWGLARTASVTRQPYYNHIRFKETSAFDMSKLGEFFGPKELIAAAYDDIDNMHLYEGYFYEEKAFERHYTAQFNTRIPFSLGKHVAGYLKFGGKYIHNYRDRDRGEKRHRLDNTNPGYERHHSKYGTPGFTFVRLPGTGWASVRNYLDPHFDPGNFLGGEYRFGPGLNGDELNHLLNSFLLDSLYVWSPLAEVDDYSTVEKITAGYAMTEVHLGRWLMLLPGVRYEFTVDDMTGRKGNVPDLNDEPSLDHPWVADTSATAKYGRWFPMIHMRVRPLGWFDVRLAYTRTISRPRLDWLLPKKKVHGSAQEVEYGRPDLRPQMAANYDLFLSFHSNRIGLLTLGGFYKEIDDLIFLRRGHKILDPIKEGFPKELKGFWLSRPENNPFRTRLRGLEFEWQTNLRWLPSPLDGIVLNANYARIWSETHFPRSYVKQERLPVFPFVRTTVVDTFRAGRMPDQADHVANVAVGYDKGPFSARLSLLYQGNTLSYVGERPELDGFTADYLRLDLSLKLRLTRNLGLFVNWNNITDEPDESYQHFTRFPTSKEYYSWTIYSGLTYEY
ncbi:MAG: TonB-dependent receptor [candidate division KSB1 bacterium]|nr:TonB-dependent receptor [candidate division KSB1 bacterium]